mmetsp:Transcript_73563/g.157680  ORF Transcript_73563/g.157680 Transcript_73563/m.157680 type:complete len:250 (-) Transcript_73563:829-1578(-)
MACFPSTRSLLPPLPRSPALHLDGQRAQQVRSPCGACPSQLVNKMGVVAVHSAPAREVTPGKVAHTLGVELDEALLVKPIESRAVALWAEVGYEAAALVQELDLVENLAQRSSLLSIMESAKRYQDDVVRLGEAAEEQRPLLSLAGSGQDARSSQGHCRGSAAEPIRAGLPEERGEGKAAPEEPAGRPPELEVLVPGRRTSPQCRLQALVEGSDEVGRQTAAGGQAELRQQHWDEVLHLRRPEGKEVMH